LFLLLLVLYHCLLLALFPSVFVLVVLDVGDASYVLAVVVFRSNDENDANFVAIVVAIVSVEILSTALDGNKKLVAVVVVVVVVAAGVNTGFLDGVDIPGIASAVRSLDRKESFLCSST
jgi:hypothetical protein